MNDGFKNVEPYFSIHRLEISVVDKFFLAFLIDLGVVNVMSKFRDVFDDNENEDKRAIKSVGGLEGN